MNPHAVGFGWSIGAWLCFVLATVGAMGADRPRLGVEVGIEPRLGALLPLDTELRDESGRTVALREFFRGRPVVLMPVYYRCPMLCGLELTGLVRSLRTLTLSAGTDFDIITFSIDPAETADLAAAKKATYLKRYGRRDAEAGWCFLTGDAASIHALCEAVGFNATRDEQTGQFAHAAAIMICTPDGRVSRYLYGVEFAPRDLRLALVEASNGQTGTVTDRVLLFCYQYDPTNGKYGVAILNIVRGGGVLTVLVLGTSIAVMLRRERKTRRRESVLDQSQGASPDFHDSNRTPSRSG